MNFLVTADWQAGWNNLERCAVAARRLMIVCTQKGVDTIVFAGDLKSAYNPVDLRMLRFWTDIIEEWSNAGLRILVLQGNHDRTSLYSDDPDFLSLLAKSGAESIKDAMVVDGLALLPYSATPDVWKKNLNLIHSHSADYLIFHQNLRGAKYNHQGGVNTNGVFSVPDLKPERFKAVIGGDIHLSQKIHSNVWYVGSPFAQDWGECNQEKFFCVVKNGTVEFVPTGMPGWYDPLVKGFKPPSDWSGSMIRIRVPIRSGDVYGNVITAARIEAERKYKGAEICVQSEFSEGNAVDGVPELGLTDKEQILSYCTQVLDAPHRSEMVDYLLQKIVETGRGVRAGNGIIFGRGAGENFLCFDSLVVDYWKRGIVVVSSINKDWPGRSNGGGKTSVLDLLPVGLFGRTFKDQEADEWASRDSNKGAKDHLEFAIPRLESNGHTRVVIERTRRPAAIRLWIDGKPAETGNRISDMNKRIEAICGFSWDTFASTIYINDDEIRNFMFGTRKQRHEMLAKLLNLERFAAALEIVRQEARETRDLARVRQADATVVGARLDELKKMEPFLDDHGEQKELDDLKAALKKRRSAQCVVGEPVALNNCERILVELAQHAGELDSELRSVREGIKGWSVLKSKGKCWVCGGKIDPGKSESHLGELNQRYIELEKRIRTLHAKREKARQESYTIRVDYTHRLEERAKQDEQIRQIEIHILQLDLVIDRRKSQRAQYTRDKDALIAKEKELLEEKHKHDVRVMFLENADKILSRDGLPAYLTRAACPRLNNAAEYFSDLFSDGHIKIRFSVEEDGDIGISILNPNGGAGMKDQSDGEGRMAFVIAAFALREIAPKCNILLLDEPGDGFDPANARAFAIGLRKLKDKYSSIFLTTHNPHILDELAGENQMVVEKENGRSRFV